MECKSLNEAEILAKQLSYYRKKMDELAGDNLALDYRISLLNHELRQKQKGLQLISKVLLSTAFKTKEDSILASVIQGLQNILMMDHAYIFNEAPAATEGNQHSLNFKLVSGAVSVSQKGMQLSFPQELVKIGRPILVNRSTPTSTFIEKVRESVALRFFICVPVQFTQEKSGVMLAGRNSESAPHSPPLDESDVDILQTLSALITTQLQNAQNSELIRRHNSKLTTKVLKSLGLS